MRFYCTLPASILNHVGVILCVPALTLLEDRKTSCQADTAKIVGAMADLLRANGELLLVLYDFDQSLHCVEMARLNLPENLQCRIVGSITGTDRIRTNQDCQRWRSVFAPQRPLAIADESSLIRALGNNFGSRRSSRKNRISLMQQSLGIAFDPIAVDSLTTTEIALLSLEAHAHGLSALAFALTQPLLKDFGLETTPSTEKFSYNLHYGRSSSEQFGELLRRLGIQISVAAYPGMRQMRS